MHAPKNVLDLEALIADAENEIATLTEAAAKVTAKKNELSEMLEFAKETPDEPFDHAVFYAVKAMKMPKSDDPAEIEGGRGSNPTGWTHRRPGACGCPGEGAPRRRDQIGRAHV